MNTEKTAKTTQVTSSWSFPPILESSVPSRIFSSEMLTGGWDIYLPRLLPCFVFLTCENYLLQMMLRCTGPLRRWPEGRGEDFACDQGDVLVCRSLGLFLFPTKIGWRFGRETRVHISQPLKRDSSVIRKSDLGLNLRTVSQTNITQI